MTIKPIVISVLFCLATALIAPLIGSTPIDYSQAFAGASPHKEILFEVRLPRVILSLLAGGMLAVAGLLFQSLLRDALATPYTLGVSSGASLGAVFALSVGLPGLWFWSQAGALMALALVLVIARQAGRMSTFTLLLAGVTINSMCLALVLFLQSISTAGSTVLITRWLMGSIDTVEPEALILLACVTVPAAVVLYLRARDWNLLALGEDWAASRGVSVQRVLLLGYLLGSLLTGAVTTLTGPIGFIGLIVPHALRLRLGADQRLLFPVCFFTGAGFLTLCDTAARTMLAPSEVPVGVITALVGGPVFIYLLRRRSGSAIS